MSFETFILAFPSVALEVAGKGALISLVVLGTVLVLRRASAASRHLLLVLAAVSLLLLPVLTVVLPSRELAVLPAEPASPVTAMEPAQDGHGLSQVVALRPAQPVQRAFPPTDLRLPAVASLALFVLAVSALLLARLFLAVRRLTSLYAGSLAAPQDWQELLDELRGRLGVRQRVRLGISPAVAVPVTFGWRRAVVLLPEAARGWEEAQLQEALLHEIAHVRRRDWPLQMIARAARALYWFNPLVWLLCRRLLLEAELACDDQVLRTGAGPAGYAGRLVALAREVRSASRRPAAAVAFARPSGLASRVAAILDPGRRRGGPGRLAIAGAAAAALILLLLVAPARLVRAEQHQERAERFTAASSFPVQSLPPLLRAAWEGDEEEVGRLIDAGADPNQAVPRLGTPLILAATRGHEDVVAVLLAKGADPARAETMGERPGDLQRTPLGAAAQKGDLEVVRLLLAARVPVDLAPRGDATPLMTAAERGHAEVVEALIAAGADPNAIVPGDGTPLIAAARGGDAQIVRRLLALGAEPNVYVTGDETALQQAIEHGHAEAARVLIGAWKDPLTKPALERAVEQGAREGAREALEDMREEDWLESITDGIAEGVVEGKREALIEAAKQGDLAAVRFLLQQGADPNGIVPNDGSPLTAAAAAGHAEVVRELLAAGADVNQRTPNDENPLIQAAWKGRLEVVRLLLDAGAYPNVGVNANRSPSDPGGELRTPLLMARRGGHRDVERLLLERGARE